MIMLAVLLHYGNGKAITFTNNENINKAHDEGQPAAWRQKRSADEPSCYTGNYALRLVYTGDFCRRNSMQFLSRRSCNFKIARVNHSVISARF